MTISGLPVPKTQGRRSVEKNLAESRYEIYSGGELAAFARFYVDGDKIVLFDTQVEPAHRGEGSRGSLPKRRSRRSALTEVPERTDR